MRRHLKSHTHNEPWIEIPPSRPADYLFGKTGAFKYRQLDDKDNVGDLQIMVRNGLTKEERLVVLPYTCVEGFQAWLGGALIQKALPFCSASTRDELLGIF